MFFMKRMLISTALALTLAALAALPVMAAQTAPAMASYNLEVDGESVGQVDACVMVPLRAVAEPLGFTVTWQDGAVLVDNGVVHTTVVIGQDRYTVTTSNPSMVGMSAPFSLGAAPYVENNTTYVPLALFRPLLGNREDAVTVEQGTIVVDTGASA